MQTTNGLLEAERGNLEAANGLLTERLGAARTERAGLRQDLEDAGAEYRLLSGRHEGLRLHYRLLEETGGRWRTWAAAAGPSAGRR